MNALNWLKANNSLYANVNVNEHWVDESEANDSDIFSSLVKQPESNNPDADGVASNTLQEDDSANCDSSM